MGVAGAGKSTVMVELARRLGWRTLEGDSLHSPGNVARMVGGAPLTDEDRGPWLDAISAWMGAAAAAGERSIVTCSALRRRYRDVLRSSGADVVFVHLVAPAEVLATRIATRAGHFMPRELLVSQLATLESLDAGEWGIEIDAGRDPTAIAEEIEVRLIGP
jgi:gluconokinase